MLHFSTLARRASTLAMALSLFAPALGGPAAALADEPTVRDHRDPFAHVQILVKRIIVHDDLDWGVGDIDMSYELRTADQACPHHRSITCGQVIANGALAQFSASDGDVIQLDRVMPGAGDTIADAAASPDLGALIHDGHWFGVRIDGVERDPVDDDKFGWLDVPITDQDGQIRFGTYTERAFGSCAESPLVTDFCPAEPGAYSVEYEIRRTPLPDLRPTAFRVAEDVPGDRDDLVCFSVANRGLKSSVPFRVSLGLVGESPLVADIGAAALAAGESREQCTGAHLPDAGLHRVAVMVDPADAIVEMDEENNALTVALDRTPAGQTRAPGGLGNATTDGPPANPTIVLPSPTPTGRTVDQRPTPTPSATPAPSPTPKATSARSR